MSFLPLRRSEQVLRHFATIYWAPHHYYFTAKQIERAKERAKKIEDTYGKDHKTSRYALTLPKWKQNELTIQFMLESLLLTLTSRNLSKTLSTLFPFNLKGDTKLVQMAITKERTEPCRGSTGWIEDEFSITGKDETFVEPDMVFLNEEYLIVTEIKVKTRPNNYHYSPGQAVKYAALWLDWKEIIEKGNTSKKFPKKFVHLVIAHSKNSKEVFQNPTWVGQNGVHCKFKLDDADNQIQLEKKKPKLKQLSAKTKKYKAIDMATYLQSWNTIASLMGKALTECDLGKDLNIELKEIADLATAASNRY